MTARDPLLERVEYDLAALLHGFGGGEGHVGGNDGVLAVEQGVVGGQRGLHFEHVDPGAAQIAAVQRVGQGLGVHHRAPGGIDEQRALLHFGDVLLADQALGGFVQRTVEGDEVRLRQQFVQGDELDEGGLVPLDVPLIAQHPAAKGVEQFRRTPADGPYAHDAHRLALQLAAHQAVLGLPGAAARLHLGNVAQQREGHTDHAQWSAPCKERTAGTVV